MLQKLVVFVGLWRYLTAAVAGAADPWLFVTNAGDYSVSVIDGDLDREVKIIALGKQPQGLALRANPPLLAVANARARFVSLVDPVAREVLPEQIPAGMGPEAVAFSADGKLLFATSYYDKTVTVADVTTKTLVGDPIQFAQIPRQLLVTPDGARLLVLLFDEQGAVAVVNTGTRTVEATIPVGRFPRAFVLSPDGKRLFAASYDARTVRTIDLATMKPIQTDVLEAAFGLAIHPTRPLLYQMLAFDEEVLVFDYAARSIVSRITVGGAPNRAVVTPDGRFLYVVNSDGNNVVKIDTETNEPVVRIAVGADPQDAVIFESGGGAILGLSIMWAAAVGAGLALAAAILVWLRIRRVRR